MSEHYIQEQYLIKKITNDFFTGSSDTIRVKDIKYDIDDDDISVDSAETVESLEKDVMDEEYYYLDSDKELSTIFDICDNDKNILEKFKIFVCPYKINRQGLYPFLEYYLIENDGELDFITFEFQCATNILSNEGDLTPKDVYFQNECMKTLLKYATPNSEETDDLDSMYKGFVQSNSDKNVLYVVFDIGNFTIKDNLTGTTIFEIVNTHTNLDKKINNNVNTLFIEQSSLLNIKDSKNKLVKNPHVLYKTFTEDKDYKNELIDDGEFISLIEKSTDDNMFGENAFLFTASPIKEDDISKLKRYAVFIENPFYNINKVEVNVQRDEGFTLGKAIPSAVKYFSKRDDKESKEESGSDEEEESESGEEEESESGEEEEGESGEEEESESGEEEESESGEEEESESGEEEESEISKEQKLLLESSKNNASVYYQQLIDGKNMAIWMIKSSRHFIEI